MNGNYLNLLLGLNAKQSRYRIDGGWFHHLTMFPGILFDSNGYVWFETEESYLNHPGLQRTKDLHVRGGIAALDTYQPFTNYERQLVDGVESVADSDVSDVEQTVRVRRTINMILRNKALVDEIKTLYDNTCQICGIKVAIGNDRYYSEVHHIIPLGKPHSGRDKKDNMICVCPNHHAQLDFNFEVLEVSKFLASKHPISEASIAHHNTRVRL
jgi:5-methylcytosine-specific restriction enzyme A